ncbi:shikimate kinase [Hwanghaeella sp.]|uniref:shikimate kinase n=1 Tax=Hwanghaeella sp. TaxID=2605943 RepID=UPI003CCBF0E0
MVHPEEQTEAGAPVLPKTIVLIGMMGAGKSTIGRQVAERLGVVFRDADREIELAAGRTIQEIFAEFGEEHFRSGERRVIARLLEDEPFVLATGGGAFMDAETRAVIKEKAISVWLRAEFDVLWARVSKRSHRPLLKTPDPQQTLRDLITARYPTYGLADITVESADAPKDETAEQVIEALQAYLTAPSQMDER